MYTAPFDRWVRLFESGHAQPFLEKYYGSDEGVRWRDRYLSILSRFGDQFGTGDQLAIARCPAQMNIMGMHLDYGGMPSLRLAVRGADTVTVARARRDDRVRLRSQIEDGYCFPDVDFRLGEILPEKNVGTREGIMAYAGEVCVQRERETGLPLDPDWQIIPQGGLIFLESYLRDRPEFTTIGGMDALTWSNISPSGGMSSSSALLLSVAFAALGARGLEPVSVLGEEVLVDGLGSSEWLRGTRGGTADHGGMVMGRSGSLVSVGVFPAHISGRVRLPDSYASVVLDSKIPRVYDEAVKEETVAAYPIGTFVIRDLLLPSQDLTSGEFAGLVTDYRERIRFLRDISDENLGVSVAAIGRLLGELPAVTSLRQVGDWARSEGMWRPYEEMLQSEVTGKFQHLELDTPLFLRRRITYGLAEQSRVEHMVDLVGRGRMADALELIRISHAGDRDQEVDPGQLRALAEGDEGLGLAAIPGGYGRMTEDYDRIVCRINEYLTDEGGPDAGAVQRLGAGWGGNLGGLIRADFLNGERGEALQRFLRDGLGLDEKPRQTVPGEGACLLPAPNDALA